jgi:hypothetical protein
MAAMLDQELGDGRQIVGDERGLIVYGYKFRPAVQ